MLENKIFLVLKGYKTEVNKISHIHAFSVVPIANIHAYIFYIKQLKFFRSNKNNEVFFFVRNFNASQFKFKVMKMLVL